MIEYYQEKIDEVNEKMKSLAKEKKDIEKELKTKGYMVENGQVKEDKSVIGLFWNMAYYASYVPEKGSMYDKGRGASEISEQLFSELKKLLENVVENEEEIILAIIDYMNIDHYFLEEKMDRGELTIKEDSIKWIVKKGTGNQGDIEEGSYFEIKRTTKDEINKTKKEFKEDSW